VLASRASRQNSAAPLAAATVVNPLDTATRSEAMAVVKKLFEADTEELKKAL